MLDLQSRSRCACMLALIGACIPWSAGCEGTETDNPVSGAMFQGSQCKKYEYSEDGVALRVKGIGIALTASSNYDGLNCFAWEVGDDSQLHVDVLNDVGPCTIEVDWQYRIEHRGTALELVVVDARDCVLSGCGACVYDFSFVLQGVDVTAPLPLTLRQEFAGCVGLDERGTTLTLPLDKHRQGIVCRQLEATVSAWLNLGGAAHAACPAYIAEQPVGANGGCDPGLVCDGTNGTICLTPCESESDCPLGDVESCEGGLCRVPEAF